MTLDLHAAWFFGIGALFAVYVAFDGFDLGAGILHLFAEKDEDRRIILNAVGPFWDGNEVWLLAAGIATFGAFPKVFAAVASGFYSAILLLLLALIGRAVSFEFRSKLEAPAWRGFWDRVFAISSGAAALLLGVAFGNLARGVPLTPEGEFAGTFLGLLNPYALLMGLLAVSVCALHGALFLAVRTEGDLQEKTLLWARRVFPAAAALLAAILVLSPALAPRIAAALGERRHLWFHLAAVIPLAALLRAQIGRGRPDVAFLCSSFLIAALGGFFAGAMFPEFLLSLPSPENSLTVYNAASTPGTLRRMLLIAASGLPVVLGYTIFVYHVFRDKVRVGPADY